MLHFHSALLLLGAIALAPASAAPPDPTDAALTVPPTVYRSAFDGYRPNREQAVGDWRQANDAVARAGGWRAYAREAQAPAPAAPATAPTPTQTPAAGGSPPARSTP